MRLPALLLLPLFWIAPAPAQDDILAIERSTDARRHAAAVRLLKSTRMQFVAEDMTPRQLCRLLSTVIGDKLTFICGKRDSEAAPKLDVELKSASLWSIMAIAQNEIGMRFVFRHGVVFMVPADAVKPLTYLRVYNLRGQCMPLRSFPGPDLRLRTADDDRPLFPEEVESGTTVSGFTADGLEALITESVQPDSWSNEGVTFINQDGLLLVRQTPQAHREIRRLLVQVGLIAPIRIVRPRQLSRLRTTRPWTSVRR